MIKNITAKTTFFLIIALFVLNSCANRGDARKIAPNAKDRVKANMEQGKGFRLKDTLGGRRGGDFEFASSNELWRASLDTIDFIPIATANYSGGILITDWYSSDENSSESIKISIRFLTNEVRSDALNIKVFYKKCQTVENCVISQKKGNLRAELTKEILKKAAIYKKQNKDKNFKPYTNTSTRGDNANDTKSK